jgi:hypothetical protein
MEISTMAVIDEARKFVQDFIAPDLRSLDARMTALETTINVRFEAAEQVAQARHNQLTGLVEGIKASLDLDKRVSRIESRQRVVKTQ